MVKKIAVFPLVLCMFLVLVFSSYPISASAEYVSGENVSFSSGNYSYSDCEDILSLSITNNSSYDTGYDVLEHYTTNYPIDSYYHFCYILSDGSTSYFIFYFLKRTAEFYFDTSLSSIRAYSLNKSSRNSFMISSSGVLTSSGGYLQADSTWTCTLNSSYYPLGSSSGTQYECVYIASGTSIGAVDTNPIEVTLTPDLSGSLSLSGVSESPLLGGLPITYTSFHLKVQNNTSDNYIYSFTIYDSANNIVYRYLSYEWVYGTDIKSGTTLHPTSWRTEQLKGSAWHMVTGNSFRNVSFNWSQIPLKANTSYTAVVEACPNAIPDSTNIVTMISRSANSENEEIYNSIDDAEVYYQSSFYISDFGSVSYDYSDTTNGIIPYKSEEDFARAVLTRKASVDNGVTDYDDYSAFDDPDSWYNTGSTSEQWELRNQHNEEVKAGLWNVSSSSLLSGSAYASAGSGGSGGSSYGSVASNFGGFFSMLSTVFGYFPSAVLSMISFGISVLVVVAIIKKVFA